MQVVRIIPLLFLVLPIRACCAAGCDDSLDVEMTLRVPTSEVSVTVCINDRCGVPRVITLNDAPCADDALNRNCVEGGLTRLTVAAVPDSPRDGDLVTVSVRDAASSDSLFEAQGEADFQKYHACGQTCRSGAVAFSNVSRKTSGALPNNGLQQTGKKILRSACQVRFAPGKLVDQLRVER